MFYLDYNLGIVSRYSEYTLMIKVVDLGKKESVKNGIGIEKLGFGIEEFDVALTKWNSVELTKWN